MWLLGNLFCTKGFGGLSGALWKIFEITTGVMVDSTENYGILRGAILVAADLSDFFPKSLASHDRHGPTGCKRPNKAK